ncbi:pyrroloquinoline quinone biosynthesis protein PqqE [compost metagenome]
MLTGDAANADPVCSKSPHHGVILKAREEAKAPGQGMEHLTLRNEKASRLIYRG